MNLDKIHKLKELLLKEYRKQGKTFNPLNCNAPVNLDISNFLCTWDEIFCAINCAKLEFDLDPVPTLDDERQEILHSYFSLNC